MSDQPYSSSDPQGGRDQQAPPAEEPALQAAEEPEPAQPARDWPAPWPRRAALVLIAALAGLSYCWASSQATVEFYYAAAVRSMSVSWHDFIFGAFDPAGTITLDKLPGAFWIQALAVRALGFHTWVIILPQVVEGVLTVLVLYRAVSRLAGPAAGLIAALIVAASPATVALNRGNISDSLMILLLVLAADAVSAAIATREEHARRAQALLILAAFWVAGILAGIMSLAWMTAVTLVPAANRPYADGSSDNSVYSQVFVYNGFGRFGDQTPVQLLASQLAPDQIIPIAPSGANRLFTGNLGRDTGWLLPAAFAAVIWGIASRWRRPRGDRLRACFVLWGAWLLILTVTFSLATFVQTYYTAALTPAIAALLAAAAVSVLAPRLPGENRRPGENAARRIGLAIVSAGTTAYAVWLVPADGAHVPGWLVPAIIAVGAVAIVVIIGSTILKRGVLPPAPLAPAVAAALVAPAVASAGLTAHHESAFDAPFEPTRLAALIASAPAKLAKIQQTIPRLQAVQANAPDLLAAQSSYIAAVFIYTSGLEALPIGGFTGTIPSPTLAQLKTDIASHHFHLVLALSTKDPRMRWIATHCRDLSPRTFLCIAPNAAASSAATPAEPGQPGSGGQESPCLTGTGWESGPPRS